MSRGQRTLIYIIVGLALLLTANILTPWASATYVTVIMAVLGMVFLFQGAENHGRRMVEKEYNITPKKKKWYQEF